MTSEHQRREAGHVRRGRGIWTCAAIALTAMSTSATVVMTASAPASAAAAVLRGADVASYQHSGGSGINWDSYARAGHSFVFIKATEGGNYANPFLAGDWTGSAAAGLQHAAYHYARPALPLSTATSQARFFVRALHTSRLPGQLPPVLDLEESGGLSPRQLISWTSQWLTTVRQLTGSVPMIYSYPYFWRTAMSNTTAFTRYPLWIASYGRSTPDMFGGWRRYTFWQYDAFGSAGGISGNGSVDLNRFNGSLADLQQLGGGAVYAVNTKLRSYWTSTGGTRGVGPATAPATRIGNGLGQNFYRATAFSTSAGLRVISGPIRDSYVALNGPSSLGLPTAAVAAVPGVAGAQVAPFQKGPIYWSAATGAHAVTGPFLTHYQLLGGPATLGLPTADTTPVPTSVGAQVEVFRGGRIYWSPTTAASALTGAILSRYVGLGAGAAALGLPTTDVAAVPGVAGGQAAAFQNGRMYWSAASGAHVVAGSILDHYLAVGGPTSLGLPTADAAAVPGVAGAQVVTFKGGRVYSSPSTGAFALSGPVLSRYLAAGGPAVLGMPTSDVSPVAGITGAQFATFQNGRIYSSPATHARVMSGPVLDHYLTVGGPAVLGLPTSDLGTVPHTAGAQTMSFTGGRIYWSSATGASALTGPILSRYLRTDGELTLGLPTSDVVPVDGVAGAQMATFQNGRIYSSAATGAWLLSGPILGHYLSAGGPANLGLPRTDAVFGGRPGSRVVVFERGRIYWSASTGAATVTGQILSRYLRQDAVRALGLPTSDTLPVAGAAGAQVVTFQSGSIYASAATGARLLNGPILNHYLAAGGPARLGLPTAEAAGAGRAGSRVVTLTGSRIYWSAKTGAHDVLGAVLATYLRTGGARGRLGLPAGDEHAISGGRAQDFVGGRITWRPRHGTTVTYHR